MNDINVPGTSASNKSDFQVSSIASQLSFQDEKKLKEADPSDKVKVNFEKFVNLVASHDFEDVMKRHGKEDIILSTNLLTDLASAHEEVEPKTSKAPLFFAIGIVLGIVLTYLLTR